MENKKPIINKDGSAQSHSVKWLLKDISLRISDVNYWYEIWVDSATKPPNFHTAYSSYTTCMLHSNKVIHHMEGLYKELMEVFNQQYPEEKKDAVENNK